MEYNIGDDLCRASLYFDLPGQHNYIEGGVFQFGAEHRNDILWGVGRSVKTPKDFTNKNNTAKLYSCRDNVPDMPFVPCPSVFNDIVNIPVGKKQILILGGSDTIGRSVHDIPNVTMNSKEYVSAFSAASRVITNSYHTAYWSLLSGREIKLLGYSSKFCDLFKIFDLDISLISQYVKGDFLSFSIAVSRLKTVPWVSVGSTYKKHFRDLNIDFYNKVKEL